ncbi:TLD-domain-containing protein [Coemansia mojavensis]|nr:TLD-domain-containing protein [Coemansia mojavensis]
MGAGSSKPRSGKDSASLDAETKNALEIFIKENNEQASLEAFETYLYQYLVNTLPVETTKAAKPVHRLSCLLSSDRKVQTEHVYLLAGLSNPAASLKPFIASVCKSALQLFWQAQFDNVEDLWTTEWALTRPKDAIVQKYTTNNQTLKQQRMKHNSLGLTMVGFDEEDSSETLDILSKWLADTEKPGLATDIWCSWWQSNPVFQELLCLALNKALYPHNALLDLKFKLPGMPQRILHCPQLSPMFNDSDLLSPGLGWAISRELPHEACLNWRRVYSSKYDGRSWSTFIKSIERRGSLLILIREQQTEGMSRIFGAFLDQELERRPSWHGTSLNLLFTLFPTDSPVPGLVVYKTTGFNDHYQYFNYSTKTLPNGLGVGGQMGHFGLWIDCDFTNGHSNSAATFGSQPLSLHNEFTIDAVEVWLVRPTQRLDADDEPGMQRSAVESNPEAAAMLEMANRPMYSKDLPSSRNNMVHD